MTDEMQTKAAWLQEQLRAALPDWSIEVVPDWLLPVGEYPMAPVYTVIVQPNGGGAGYKITLTRDFLDGAQGDPVALVVDMIEQGA